MPQIKVHEKALAHLTRGLYRSPSSVLRELVSNAWDANATEIRIDTNFPLFLQMVIEDNGDGFEKQHFIALMEGGVGNSDKRITEKEGTEVSLSSGSKALIRDRPIIGRLGIGMLSIAQICLSFLIISKTKTGESFCARVRLYDLLKEGLDSDDKKMVVLKGDAVQEVNVGEYTFQDYGMINFSHGTRIIADDLHPTFIQAFRDSLNPDYGYVDMPTNWEEAINIASNVRSLQQLGDYWRLLWELSVACPLPYLRSDALPNGLIVEQQKKLIDYEFSLIVDGVKLFKPILLQNNIDGYTTDMIESTSIDVYNRRLRISGYLILQEGTQLLPAELRGILIRIKNVAVGYYDSSRLDDRYNEGPRANWITGEIFAEEGLEDALNVDRDSFNRFNPQYRVLQKFVHNRLRPLFSEAYKQIQVRSNRATSQRQESRSKALVNTLQQIANVAVQVETSKSNALSNGDTSIEIVEKDNNIIVISPNPLTLKTKKSHQHLAASLLVLYAFAQREIDPDHKQEAFAESLLSLLKDW